MKRSNRKGFTIVELVIVIAVIAILTAVLIPTFGGIIEKANISNDTVVAKNLNTAAIAAEADTFEEAIAAARDAGYYLANLNAKANDCYFVWEDETNQFLLYNLKTAEIIYSNTEIAVDPDDSWCFAVNNATVADAVLAKHPNVTTKNTVSSVSDIKDTVAAGGDVTIYVDESVIMDKDSVIVVDDSSANITIDLGVSTIAGNNSSTPKVENIPFNVIDGNLTIKGGVIQATGTWKDSDGEVVSSALKADNGTVNIDSSTIDCGGSTIVLAYAGANGTISNAVINALSSAINVGGNSNVVVENCTVNVDNEAIWVTASGGYNNTQVTVKGGTYNGVGNTIAMYGGKIIIEDGVFTSQKANLFKFYAEGSTIIIKGGTFNGKAVSDLDLATVKAMFSASTKNLANLTVTRNADGSVTIAN